MRSRSARKAKRKPPAKIKVMNRGNRKDIVFSFTLVALVVVIFLLQITLLPQIGAFGLVPRTPWGLVGILTMPFLHASVGHLLANLGALAFLLAFLIAFHPQRMPAVVVRVVLVGGALLWICGRPANHVGASGLIYGLAAFVIVAGIVQKKLIPVIGAIGVAVLYGSSLFWGLVPSDPRMSWDGHLAGGVAGVLVAGRKGGRGK
jgi:membrane associated rhomboid family serine protease